VIEKLVLPDVQRIKLLSCLVGDVAVRCGDFLWKRELLYIAKRIREGFTCIELYPAHPFGVLFDRLNLVSLWLSF
jgi:hypothetical protein